MGLYATTTSISRILPTFLRGNTTTSDTEGTLIFDSFITGAENIINVYIGERYELPFAAGAVPPILATLAEDIACYRALRGTLNQDGGPNKNPYLDEYETAMEILKKIAEGTTPLTLTDGSLVPVITTDKFISTTKNYTPIFGLDSATSWRRDPDEVRDTQALRDEI